MSLKSQSNGPLQQYGDGTLAVDGWAVTFGRARRGLGELGSRPVPSSWRDLEWRDLETGEGSFKVIENGAVW